MQMQMKSSLNLIGIMVCIIYTLSLVLYIYKSINEYDLFNRLPISILFFPTLRPYIILFNPHLSLIS